VPIVTIKSGVSISEAMRGDVAAAVNAVAERVLTASQQLVPLLEGTLEQSGTVSKKATEGDLFAELSYGTPYGRYQHERTDLRHPNGRQAKYLSDPLRSVGVPLLLAELRRIAGRG
jgi:hypothetical protein